MSTGWRQADLACPALAPRAPLQVARQGRERDRWRPLRLAEAAHCFRSDLLPADNAQRCPRI